MLSSIFCNFYLISWQCKLTCPHTLYFLHYFKYQIDNQGKMFFPTKKNILHATWLAWVQYHPTSSYTYKHTILLPFLIFLHQASSFEKVCKMLVSFCNWIFLIFAIQEEMAELVVLVNVLGCSKIIF